MTERPAPLTYPDLDLRGMTFMPIDVVRLRDSDIAALATGDEFRAAVLLWCAAWHQVPAASLPSDDANLARYAGFGRDIKAWLKVKEGALRGFVECTDGRLYHQVIAEKATEADNKRRAYRERTAAATRARIDRQEKRDDQRNVERDDERNEDQGKVSVSVRDSKKDTPSLRSGERKRGFRLPDDFVLSDELIEFSAQHGFAGDQLQSVFADFCDYWRSRDGPQAKKLDWDATWRRWIRQEAKKQRSQRYGNGKPTLRDTATALADKLRALGDNPARELRSGAGGADVRLLPTGAGARPRDLHDGNRGGAGGIPKGGDSGGDRSEVGVAAQGGLVAVRREAG